MCGSWTARVRGVTWALRSEVSTYFKFLCDNIGLEFCLIITIMKITKVLKHTGLSFLIKTE